MEILALAGAFGLSAIQRSGGSVHIDLHKDNLNNDYYITW